MILSQLAGIHPQDVRKPETSSLELLLKLGEEILKGTEFERFPRSYLSARENYESRASKICYDARDIESFILAHADKTYTDNQWMTLGVFTGALVSALTQKEKQTTVSVDLGNRTFHHLFTWTRKANNIIVKNLTGNDAFSFAGSYQGYIESITGINITGNNAFYWAGSYDGSVGRITWINITGDFAFWNVGNNQGNIRNITGINIIGDYAFWGAGRSKGSVESITGIKIAGRLAFSGAGSNKGSIGVVRYYDIKGTKLFEEASIHQKTLLTPQQAEEYLEIVREIESSGKSNDEIQKMIEQLNLVRGEE